MSVLQHALDMARRGFPVFPLSPGTKIPLKGSNGHLNATTDEKQIRIWFTQMPEANYGVALRASDLVLDFDPRNYPPGRDMLKEMWDQWKLSAAPTLTIKTPSGGYHFYFRKPDGLLVAKSQAEFPGVDFLSSGCYTVGPGSSLTTGEYERIGGDAG